MVQFCSRFLSRFVRGQTQRCLTETKKHLPASEYLWWIANDLLLFASQVSHYGRGAICRKQGLLWVSGHLWHGHGGLGRRESGTFFPGKTPVFCTPATYCTSNLHMLFIRACRRALGSMRDWAFIIRHISHIGFHFSAYA